MSSSWLLLPLLAGSAEDRAQLAVPVHLRASTPTCSLEAGGTVTLAAATLTLADLRLEAPAETASRSRGWSLDSVAHAHPGHDFAGEVADELTGTWTVDLLGGETVLGEATCCEGPYATARLDLLPEPAVRLAGTAAVDGALRCFIFELAPHQEITGLPSETTPDAEAPPGGIAVAVDLAHTPTFVDRTTPDDDGDGALTTADRELDDTVRLGLVSTPTYTLALED